MQRKSVESNHKQRISYIRREQQLDWQFSIAKKEAQRQRNLQCSVQSLSHAPLIATPWTTACQSSLSITNTQNPPKLMSTKLMMPSNHLILCCPLLLLPSIFPSVRVLPVNQFFTSGGQSIKVSALASSPSNEYSGLISFGIDWLDVLAVQGTLKSLLQHHGSKASILQCSAFFIVQLTSIHDHWKNHNLD